MQISGELIHGVRVAANMAQNLLSDGNKLMEKQDVSQQQAHQKALNAAVTEAVAKEQRKGITAAVMAMLESGIPYESIVNLLRKFWDISDAQAREFAVRGQTVEYPARKLGEYLQSQGWTPEEIIQYMKDNSIKKKLRLDHELWKLSPEDLIDRVEE